MSMHFFESIYNNRQVSILFKVLIKKLLNVVATYVSIQSLLYCVKNVLYNFLGIKPLVITPGYFALVYRHVLPLC